MRELSVLLYYICMELTFEAENLKQRLDVCKFSGNPLTADEAISLVESFQNDRISGQAKLYRDHLIEFLPAEFRSKGYAAAVGSLVTEISQQDFHANTEMVSDLSGQRLFAENTRALDLAELLKQRLKVLSDFSFIGLSVNGKPTIWANSDFGVTELLYKGSLTLQEPTAACKLASRVFLTCNDFDEQRAFLNQLLSTFPDSENIHIRAMDLLCSDVIQQDFRLGVFQEMLMIRSPNHHVLAHEGLKRFEEILPQSYFDEHLFRFLDSVGTRFHFDHIQYVIKPAFELGITNIGIEPLNTPPPRGGSKVAPSPGLGTDVEKLGQRIFTHVKRMQNEILRSSI